METKIIKDLIEEKKIDKVKFYYHNLVLIGNIYTVCVLIKDNKIVARGITIRSLLDGHIKNEARKRSLARALSAFFTKQDSDRIRNEFKDKYFIKRIIHIKNDKEKNEKIKMLDNLGFYFSFKISKDSKKIIVNIPQILPIQHARLNFRYKSQIYPKPTEEELRFIS